MKKSIKLHGSVWKIKKVSPTSKHLDRGKDSGCADFGKHVIYLNKELCEERADFVLYHELFHILLDHTGLCNKVRSDTEEAVCDAFAAFVKEYFILR